jgi:hypothetical protein
MGNTPRMVEVQRYAPPSQDVATLARSLLWLTAIAGYGFGAFVLFASNNATVFVETESILCILGGTIATVGLLVLASMERSRQEAARSTQALLTALERTRVDIGQAVLLAKGDEEE